jgi:hypothetical protein
MHDKIKQWSIETALNTYVWCTVIKVHNFGRFVGSVKFQSHRFVLLPLQMVEFGKYSIK